MERDVRLVDSDDMESVQLISDAYDIAHDFLVRSGLVVQTDSLDHRLVILLCLVFESGRRNRLWLANLAIQAYGRDDYLIYDLTECS